MGQFREHQVLRERSWLACESGGPTLEILLNFMNADRRLDARNISLHRTETQVVDFKNREHIPDFLRSVRNSDVFITQAFTQGEFWDEDPAKSIMLADPSRLDREIVDLQWTIGSVRGCHAKSISLDLGFFPYGRSDKKFKGGQYIIAKSFLEALDAQAGIRADTIVTYDLHNEAIAGFPNSFGMDPLSAEMLFAIYFRNLQEIKGRPLVVVSPDSGGAKRAERLSLLLGTDLAIGYKSRKQGEEAKLKKIIGEIRKGSIAVVFDDMIDGGGTAKPVAEMLYKMGAKQVYFAITHGLFSKSKGKQTPEDMFREYNIKVVCADTVPRSPEYLETNKDWLTMVTVAGNKSDFVLAPYFGDTVRDVFRRYKAIARGHVRYNSKGYLDLPDGTFSGMAHRTIAYDNLNKLILPNPSYLAAWRQESAFRERVKRIIEQEKLDDL